MGGGSRSEVDSNCVKEVKEVKEVSRLILALSPSDEEEGIRRDLRYLLRSVDARPAVTATSFTAFTSFTSFTHRCLSSNS